MNGPTHTVGSHSDDRGGESDWPCYCDQNVAPSNSKSEDTPLIKDYMGNVIGAIPEPPQDTSLEKQVEELVESIWFDGENGGFDGSSVHEWYQKESKKAQEEYVKDILKLLAQQQAKLLQVIEDEVIGGKENIHAKDPSGTRPWLLDVPAQMRNDLRAEQRQAIKKIKERYE